MHGFDFEMQHRGQGATEYLVLLAVVLIVALVSVALLGFFPGMASDAKITESSGYWRAAKPFAIIDSTINASGGGVLTIESMEANGQYVITNVMIGLINSTNLTSTTFSPGEIKNVFMTTPGFGTNIAGVLYEYNVTITYNTPGGITGVKQYGAKNLVDRYV